MNDEPPHPRQADPLRDYGFEPKEPIGKGSFGTVYRAVYKGAQERAVKFFDPVRVNTALIERELQKFRAVSQHPGVVTVYDFDLVCATPFYAMGLHAEQIMDADGSKNWRGRTLEDKVGKTDATEGMRLLKETADALAYLHRHQIIHCDVKPGNVLLTDEGHVKLCDFGQSRRSDDALTELSGTLLYAAPEQLRAPTESGDGKGLRWDVYSFGVLAYRIVTGIYPRLMGAEGGPQVLFTRRDSMTGHDNPLLEATLVALDAEAGKPLQWPEECWLPAQERKVIGQCLALEAGQRPGDMLAVREALLKAQTDRELEIERQRREEAESLRAEAERRRHVARRFALVATGAALLAVGAGVWALTKQKEAAAQRDEAERQRGAANKSEMEAQQAKNTAEGLINSMLYDLRDKLRPLGKQGLLDDISRQTEKYFVQQDPALMTPDALRNMGAMFINRGDVLHTTGDLKAAGDAYQKGLDIFQRLAQADPGNALIQRNLATGYERFGDAARAEGNLQAVHEAYAKSFAITQQLAQSAPADARAQRDLAISHQKLGNEAAAEGHLEDARTAYEKALAILLGLAQGDAANNGTQLDLSIAYNKVGDVVYFQGNLKAARENYEKALAIRQHLVQAAPSDVQMQRDLSSSYERMGDLARAEGDLKAERTAYEASHEIRERLVQADPGNALAQRDLAISRYKLGEVAQAESNSKAASEAYDKALEIRQRLVQADAANAQVQGELADSYNKVGEMARAGGDLKAARAAYEKASEITQRLAQADPTNAEAQRDLAVSFNRLGDMGLAESNLKAAREAYEKALTLFQHLAQNAPTSAEALRDLAISHENLGDLAQPEGDLKAAKESYEKEREIGRKLVATMPDQPRMVQLLGYASLREALVWITLEPSAPKADLRAMLEEGRAPLLKLQQAGRLPDQQKKLLSALEELLQKLN